MGSFRAFRDHAPKRTPEYATVKAVVANQTDWSVLLINEQSVIAQWVKKSALDLGSKLALSKPDVRGKELELRIDLPAAKEANLL